MPDEAVAAVGGIGVDAFRARVRAWLDEHCTERYRGLQFRGDPDADWLTRMREWNNLLADAGLMGIDWPVEHGGRGLGIAHQAVLSEELDRARAPGTLNPIGLANIAPSIMAFGTPDQQRRLLPPMLRGDEIWCQGFSEPGAGSDLAAIATRAERTTDADGQAAWRVTGQKVWNTFGQIADWCELLVRTDPGARTHDGLSCFLVDMSLPGSDVRPLRTAAGDADFCEIFLDGVLVPDDARLGAEGDGWRVAMTTLTFERSGVAHLHIGTRRRVRELIDDARHAGYADDPVVRQRLATLWTEAELARLLSERATARAVQGQPPGPESSLVKLAWGGATQHLAMAAANTLGLGALAGEWGHELLQSRSATIAGGTTEVNKNVVAERVLGLPREPR